MAEEGGLRLAGIRAYPLKGAGGVELERATPDAFGIPGDRRWMLVSPDGTFISQRTHPRLCLLRVREAPREDVDQGLRYRVEAPEMGSRLLRYPGPDPEGLEVQVHKDRFPAQLCGEEEDRWFSQLLGEACRLAFFPDSGTRLTDPDYAVGHRTAFSDGYPLHLVTTESLRELNGRLAEPLSLDRFRPNLVVEGGEAWDEDRWRLLQVGGVRIQVVKPCARCSVTLVDQGTARVGAEPLATMAEYRRWEEKTYFGQNAVVASPGSFAQGDDVRILERGAARPPLP